MSLIWPLPQGPAWKYLSGRLPLLCSERRGPGPEVARTVFRNCFKGPPPLEAEHLGGCPFTVPWAW